MEVEELLGKIVVRIEEDIPKNRFLIFTISDGTMYRMYHVQDCCEFVYLNDICGDLNDLIGSKILLAEKIVSNDSIIPELELESFTWTFYKFATIKGYVDLRWFGSSNGYYSESVYFELLDEKDEKFALLFLRKQKLNRILNIKYENT